MVKFKLIDYLKIVLDLEVEKYVQTSLIEILEKEKRHIVYQIPDEISKPEYPAVKERDPAWRTLLEILWFLAFWGGVILGGLYLLGCMVSSDSNFSIAACCLLFGPMLVIGTIKRHFDNKFKGEAEFVADSEYAKAMSEYQVAVAERQAIIERNKQVADMQRTTMDIEIEKLKKQQEQTQTALNRTYTLNVLYKKYHDMALIASILELLESGICTTLKGTDGAYKNLEIMLRLDKIICGIDRINANLEKIRQNQFLLYTQLRKANRHIDELVYETRALSDSMKSIDERIARNAVEMRGKLEELAHNSAITRYTAQQSQDELHYMNQLGYHVYTESGGSFKSPPM